MQENGEKNAIFSLEDGASAYSLEFRGEGNLAMGIAKCTPKRHERFGDPAEHDRWWERRV